MKQCTLAFLSILNGFALWGSPLLTTQEQLQRKTTALFIENKGQIKDQFGQERKDIRFLLKTPQGLSIFSGDASLHYQFVRAENSDAQQIDSKNKFATKTKSYTMYRMDVRLLGANAHPKIISEEPGAYLERYYTDKSGEEGLACRSFAKIIYKDIYPHIDWVLYTKDGVLKHEFLVHPGGKVSAIRIQYDGAKELNINSDGSLKASTALGTLTEHAPLSWQQDGSIVQSAFRLDGSVLSYDVASYNGELLIDPVLEWSTYYGGLSADVANNITSDPNNNVYLIGNTTSVSNIATTGAFQTSINGIADAFVLKFNPSGNCVWGTYWGGSSNDYGFGIACDKVNNVYCVGGTTSSFGIATTGAHQMSSGGLQDAMALKFDSTGKRLWSTFFGGLQDEQADQIAVDTYGHVYLGGYTSSSTAIATSGAFQPSSAGGARDAFLARFDESGKRIWSTYFGGPDVESGDALSCDSKGNVYLAGSTLSNSGIATSAAHQTTYSGGFTGDAYLARFDSSGKRLWSTYYGGANGESANALACDFSDHIYLCGQTESASGIATSGAFKSSNNGFEAYLVRFDPTGKRLWGTYFGDATSFRQESGNGLATDALNNVYLSGKADSCGGLATTGAYQAIAGGDDDAFLARFDSLGNRLWGSYFGGSQQDVSIAAASDRSGNIYITGYTASSARIASAGAFKTTFSGSFDIFLAKFCFEPKAAIISSVADTVCIGATLTLSNKVPGGIWLSKTGKLSFIGSTAKGLSAGIDTVLYVVTNSCGSDTARKAIRVVNCVGSNIAQAVKEFSALIMPNPAKDMVTVQMGENITELLILDMSGRELFKAEPNKKETNLDVSFLPTGIYCLRINGTIVHKLVKE